MIISRCGPCAQVVGDEGAGADESSPVTRALETVFGTVTWNGWPTGSAHLGRPVAVKPQIIPRIGHLADDAAAARAQYRHLADRQLSEGDRANVCSPSRDEPTRPTGCRA
jgi:hypothetical protein